VLDLLFFLSAADVVLLTANANADEAVPMLMEQLLDLLLRMVASIVGVLVVTT
jgi:hypothetical protein